MCGILGTLGSNNLTAVEDGLARIAHRGPDGQGTWQEQADGIILGHRRLAIIDPTASGAQPMHRGELVISFNGEIYNFLEIKKQLEQLGEQFHTDSDTEVVLAAFSRWGPECLTRFNGMWALAIWNRKSKTLFLARDRFGKKPLFFSFAGEGFAFASEMKGLFPLLPRVAPSKHFPWIQKHLFEYESTDRCLIEGIERFPAGSYAYIRESDISEQRIDVVRYWNTLDHLVDVPETYDQQVQRFRELFLDACRIRMRSDVPIGTALSGGMDSSSVSCSMKYLADQSDSNSMERMAEDWQRSFIATFPGTVLDERNYAESVVDHVGANAIFLEIDPAAGIEHLDRHLYYFEELYLTSPIPMMEIYRTVAEHGVKVTIDGHGADEMLSGYDSFLEAIKDCGLRYGYARHIVDAFGIENPSPGQVYATMRRVHRGSKNMIKHLGQQLLWAGNENVGRGELGHFNRALYRQFHETMLPTLLRNYDRYSMANSIEIRMPFMDHRLVSFCFSLPWQSKIPRSSRFTKALLRDAVGDLLPPLVRNRKSKIGFNTPIVEWLKGPWKSFILDTIGSSSFSNCSLIDSHQVKQSMEAAIFEDVPYHQADKAWAAIMPYFWEDALINHSTTVSA